MNRPLTALPLALLAATVAWAPLARAQEVHLRDQPLSSPTGSPHALHLEAPPPTEEEPETEEQARVRHVQVATIVVGSCVGVALLTLASVFVVGVFRPPARTTGTPRVGP